MYLVALLFTLVYWIVGFSIAAIISHAWRTRNGHDPWEDLPRPNRFNP
jgi:hypothetical protein